MTELNHQGITKALANLRAATTANVAATAQAAEAGYATPPGQAPTAPAGAGAPNTGAAK